jgi:hypothetical protein
MYACLLSYWWPCRMWRSAAQQIFTDVSEECVPSIMRFNKPARKLQAEYTQSRPLYPDPYWATARSAATNKIDSVAWVRERTIPTGRPPLVGEVSANFYRILSFLDQIRNFFFQVAPQLYSRGWVDPVPDPLLPRKCVSAVNRNQTSGSVARNCDH